jgi:hypothetical protein
MAISTARNALASLDGKLDPSMVGTERSCKHAQAAPRDRQP